MRVTRLGRIIGAVALASAFVLTVSGTSSASQPGWVPDVTPLPATVQAGTDAGYAVKITNGGSSNISSLYLNSSSIATYVGGPDGDKCSGPGVPLSCDFGALAGGSDANVQILVAFKTGTGKSFTADFEATTTGISGDKHNHSHGDELDFSGTTQLSTDKNFAGGFSTSDDTVSTDDSIGPKNVQSTTVTPPDRDLVTTVQDDLSDSSVTYACPPGETCFGTWSQVKVRSLENYAEQVQMFNMFEVTLLVRGNGIPSSSLSTMKLVHVTDDGVTHVSDQSLSCSTPTVGCLTVTPQGNNYLLTTWVDQNGGFKGML